MIEYHKINSVYKRDPATRHKSFILGDWSTPELAALAGIEWVWTEKVDGTNIRVCVDGDGKTRYAGRTDAASIPQHLFAKLQDRFDDNTTLHNLPAGTVLFGEGYGAKIQKGGGLYIADGVDFILFDVLLGGKSWVSRDMLDGIAASLGCGFVQILGRGTLFEAIDFTRDGFASVIGSRVAEGLVMRPVVELCDRHGGRIITKVKVKDFAVTRD